MIHVYAPMSMYMYSCGNMQDYAPFVTEFYWLSLISLSDLNKPLSNLLKQCMCTVFKTVAQVNQSLL